MEKDFFVTLEPKAKESQKIVMKSGKVWRVLSAEENAVVVGPKKTDKKTFKNGLALRSKMRPTHCIWVEMEDDERFHVKCEFTFEEMNKALIQRKKHDEKLREERRKSRSTPKEAFWPT